MLVGERENHVTGRGRTRTGSGREQGAPTAVTTPDFFVIGAPKAGTTALHAALAAHPELFLSTVKEPKFYLCGEAPPPEQHGPGDAHSRREWIWRRDEYEALFATAPPGMRCGESTPFYLSDFEAQRRIRAERPDARLIAVLRDPVERAHSNWAHLWGDGLEPVDDFVAACRLEEERAAAGWAPFWRYLGLGRYGEQLEHLLGVFPREQVHVLRYRELVEAPSATLDRICAFLGVREGVITEVPALNVSTYVDPTLRTRVLQAAVRQGAAIGRHFPPQVWRTLSAPLLWALRGVPRNRPELEPAQRRELLAYFEDDIARLERVTGDSFSDWVSDRGRGTYSVRKSCPPPSPVSS